MPLASFVTWPSIPLSGSCSLCSSVARSCAQCRPQQRRRAVGSGSAEKGATWPRSTRGGGGCSRSARRGRAGRPRAAAVGAGAATPMTPSAADGSPDHAEQERPSPPYPPQLHHGRSNWAVPGTVHGRRMHRQLLHEGQRPLKPRRVGKRPLERNRRLLLST